MDEIVRHRNIERYRKLLALTTDAALRRTLQELLAEAEAEGEKRALAGTSTDTSS